VSDFSAPTNPKAVDASSSGDNPIHTPAAGARMLLQYFSLSAWGGNTDRVTATLTYGSGGPAMYKFHLEPGIIVARNIGAGRRAARGPVGTPLIVTLSAPMLVSVSIEYEEVAA